MPDNLFVVVDGIIISINKDKRGIAIRDEQGTVTTGHWEPAQDKEFLRLQKLWFARITFEKWGDKLTAISQAAIPKPAWAERKAAKQDDEKRAQIMASVLLKSYTDLMMQFHPPDETDLSMARGILLEAVETDLPEVLRIIREVQV